MSDPTPIPDQIRTYALAFLHYKSSAPEYAAAFRNFHEACMQAGLVPQDVLNIVLQGPPQPAPDAPSSTPALPPTPSV